MANVNNCITPFPSSLPYPHQTPSNEEESKHSSLKYSCRCLVSLVESLINVSFPKDHVMCCQNYLKLKMNKPKGNPKLPTRRDEDERLSLHWAATHNHIDIVELLMQREDFEVDVKVCLRDSVSFRTLVLCVLLFTLPSSHFYASPLVSPPYLRSIHTTPQI